MSRMHLVIINIPNDDSQGGGAGHLRVAGVLDHNGHQEFLLLLPVKWPQGGHDRHSVAVGTLCKKNTYFKIFKNNRFAYNSSTS